LFFSVVIFEQSDACFVTPLTTARPTKVKDHAEVGLFFGHTLNFFEMTEKNQVNWVIMSEMGS